MAGCNLEDSKGTLEDLGWVLFWWFSTWGDMVSRGHFKEWVHFDCHNSSDAPLVLCVRGKDVKSMNKAERSWKQGIYCSESECLYWDTHSLVGAIKSILVNACRESHSKGLSWAPFLSVFNYAVIFRGGGGAGSTFHRTDILEKLSKSEVCKSNHFRKVLINYSNEGSCLLSTCCTPGTGLRIVHALSHLISFIHQWDSCY